MLQLPQPRCSKEIPNKEGNLKDSKYVSVEVERFVGSASLLNKRRRSCTVPRNAAHRELRV